MNEKFLHYLWKHQQFQPNLKTTDGAELHILKPGLHNSDGGPDFFNGRVRIGHTNWAGNIEIHVNSSDWYKHGHEKDPAYENVILHVVFNHDTEVFRNGHESIPTLELHGWFDNKIYMKYRSFVESANWIPCENQIATISHFDQLAWLESLMAERLHDKTLLIEKELKTLKLDFQEIFYRKLARSFGFKTNNDAFEQLASVLPLTILQKHKQDRAQMEALLFGQAGMLRRSFKDSYPSSLKSEYLFLKQKYKLQPMSIRYWRFLRMRPVNFPTVRISQFAHVIERSSGLLNNILESDKLSHVIDFFKVSVSPYWNEHFIFDRTSSPSRKQLGRSSIDLILINVVVPFLMVYGKYKNDKDLQAKALEWLETIKPETNAITKRFSKLGMKPLNAMHSQALLHLKYHYCDHKKCLNCSIGHSLLKSSEQEKTNS